GDLTWCPGNPACGPAGLPGIGRVIYRAGTNRFGGGMQMGLAGGWDVGLLLQRTPFRVAHSYYGRGAAPPLAGGGGKDDVPAIIVANGPRQLRRLVSPRPLPRRHRLPHRRGRGAALDRRRS